MIGKFNAYNRHCVHSPITPYRVALSPISVTNNGPPRRSFPSFHSARSHSARSRTRWPLVVRGAGVLGRGKGRARPPVPHRWVPEDFSIGHSPASIAHFLTFSLSPSLTRARSSGHGWDLHRLEPGYDLIIGGIKLEHDRGCVAHSDGDVLAHTVTDAILGALCLPDIGQIFPDNDPKWKGCNSDVFVKEAVRLMHERGYEIGNMDITIIAQRPKLSPHKETIRGNICEWMDVHPSVVNLKAKTHEKVDSLGENRSIACEAVVLLIRKV